MIIQKVVTVYRFETGSGRGSLFLEARITNDGSDYSHQVQILSNVEAEKGNFERETCFVDL